MGIDLRWARSIRLFHCHESFCHIEFTVKTHFSMDQLHYLPETAELV